MTTATTPQEAATLAKGCSPLLGITDRAVIMVNKDLREICRVHVWHQEWLAADGRSVSHVEIRVPAMGMVFIDDTKTHVEFSHNGLYVSRDVAGMNAWEDARREIHAWMEQQIGYTCPLMASNHQNGGWFDEAEFVMCERDIPHLRTEHPADFGMLARNAWSGFVSEPAGTKDVGELRLGDGAETALDVGAAVPFEQAETDVPGAQGTLFDEIGVSVGNDEQAAIQLPSARNHFVRPQAVGGAKGVGGRIAFRPALNRAPIFGAVGQANLLDSGSQRDVERLPKSSPNPVGPPHSEAICIEINGGRSPPAVTDNNPRLFFSFSNRHNPLRSMKAAA